MANLNDSVPLPDDSPLKREPTKLNRRPLMSSIVGLTKRESPQITNFTKSPEIPKSIAEDVETTIADVPLKEDSNRSSPSKPLTAVEPVVITQEKSPPKPKRKKLTTEEELEIRPIKNYSAMAHWWYFLKKDLKLRGATSDIADTVYRYTIGFDKYDTEDLSLNKLCTITGLSKNAVRAALSKLEILAVIEIKVSSNPWHDKRTIIISEKLTSLYKKKLDDIFGKKKQKREVTEITEEIQSATVSHSDTVADSNTVSKSGTVYENDTVSPFATVSSLDTHKINKYLYNKTNNPPYPPSGEVGENNSEKKTKARSLRDLFYSIHKNTPKLENILKRDLRRVMNWLELYSVEIVESAIRQVAADPETKMLSRCEFKLAQIEKEYEKKQQLHSASDQQIKQIQQERELLAKKEEEYHEIRSNISDAEWNELEKQVNDEWENDTAVFKAPKSIRLKQLVFEKYSNRSSES